MRDPVKLPTSGQTVDRSTIKRILLDDGHDPFNRAPLTISQVEDDLEMRERIETWKRQKLAGEVTDEEKREQAEQDQDMLPAAKEDTSAMSVDKAEPKEAAQEPVQQNPEIDFENLTEEEQIKLAMEMSMKGMNNF